MRTVLFRQLDRLAAARWARRGARRLLRAAWLAGCVWCIALGGRLLWSWDVPYRWLGAASLALVGLAILPLLWDRLPRREVARRLDRRYSLNEQLTTAVEIAGTPAAREGVGALLLATAGRTVSAVRQEVERQQRGPWSEIAAVVALALLLLGLYVLTDIGRPPGPATALAPLPEPAAPPDAAEQFPPEAAQGNGSGQQPGGQSGGAGQTQVGDGTDAQSLSALADALRDQGATRPAADALDRGDRAGAARELRELADQADQLSQQTRDDIAGRLREAGRQIDGRNPALADQLRESASGLEQGGRQAQQALDDLARAIDQGTQPGEQQAQSGAQGQNGQGQQPGDTAQQPGTGGGAQQPGQGQGRGNGAGNAPSGEQRQTSTNERLGVAGKPLELNAEGQGQPAAGDGRGPTSSGAAGGFTSGGGADDGRRVGADPLRIPIEDRDVVQEYFSK